MAQRLELRAVTKRYPGTIANDAVSLGVAPGEIHAVLGENGAGKSTLMKIVYGAIQADSGDIVWHGEKLTIASPAAARRLGIGMVYQHFSLFESVSVVENIAVAIEGTFDLPKYVQLMHAQGFTAPIAFEASVQCQARPGYDALASAQQIYRWMADGWRAAGVPID